MTRPPATLTHRPFADALGDTTSGPTCRPLGAHHAKVSYGSIVAVLSVAIVRRVETAARGGRRPASVYPCHTHWHMTGWPRPDNVAIVPPPRSAAAPTVQASR